LPAPRDSSAQRLNRERFEAAMRSEPVLQLIRESVSPERIGPKIGSSPTRVRSWLKARGLLPRGPAAKQQGAAGPQQASSRSAPIKCS
jgi:hypothetical protein